MDILRLRRTTALFPILFVLLASAVIQAHDFWLQPSSFEAAVGTALRVRLIVGDRFRGDALPRDEARIERFDVVTPAGERRRIVGRDGVDPAGVIRFDTPGLHILGYESRPSPLRLEASAFEAYLKEEGLERISEDRNRRGESGMPGRETFARSVKAFVRAGPEVAASGYDRAIGLRLEIVPERDPFAPDLAELPVRLLYEGLPVDGALLIVMRKESAGGSAADVLSTMRTGPDGRALLTIAPGVVLVKAVHMVRAQPGTAADWNSIWTSLTFETARNPYVASPRRPQ